MNTRILIAIALQTLVISVALNSCKEKDKDPGKMEVTDHPADKTEIQNQAWKMEEQYWEYVENNDTLTYKKLWHDDFIGYPSFGNGVSTKSGIAVWIPELHKDTSLIFSYKLYKKAVNALDDVVLVFYDAEEIWTDKNSGNIVRTDTLKVTHTWKKYNDTWLILGGMAAVK